MEENKNLTTEAILEQEERSSFDFQTIYKTMILNWQWFILSLIICLGAAAIYLRYATPRYQAFTKMLIKDDDTQGARRSANAIANMQNLGMMSNSTGIDNEMEILGSHSIAEAAVRDLKLYVTYKANGKVKDQLVYKTQPVTVDIDPAHLNDMKSSISLEIQREKGGYHVTGVSGGEAIDKVLTTLPATINSQGGILTFTSNSTKPMREGVVEKVTISSPSVIANKYVGALSVSQTSKMTTIAMLTLTDEIPQRAVDYLKQLAICYNRQANEDKNEVAIRTEEFINDRLEKINAELSDTESELEAYKQRHNMVELKLNASNAVQQQGAYDAQLAEANTQVALINSINEYMNQSSNQYQPLPANVGLTDQGTAKLIDEYNRIVMERNRMLRSASETSPAVAPLTAQLDELSASIRNSMAQSRRGLEIQRNSIASQYGKYAGQVGATPEQERMLTQIGRQQDVKSGLYLMLLQKREENSISLAATADKGKLIDEPAFAGKVSPRTSIIMLVAAVLGIIIPAVVFFLLNFFRYRIEGHEDVQKLTRLPILADVAVASDTAKGKADIVVHENKNNQMEEIFRSMRTNLQFMLKENEKVIMFTSTTSGEGKTFNAANISISFALLGKKVILVGLDIRKPRLAQLFEIEDKKSYGITPLLTRENITWNDVQSQILPSGLNNNLDVMLAGPIPPNPTELMARPSLDKVFEHLREHYDYIIIDTAPVGLVTDTLQVGRVTDATVYMCRADYTPKESFILINSLSEEKKLPNMSVVINGIDMSKKKYGYYYGYGAYGRYGRYGRYGGYKSYGGKYGHYGSYGYGGYGGYGYGAYGRSHYGDKNDTSIKLKK